MALDGMKLPPGIRYLPYLIRTRCWWLGHRYETRTDVPQWVSEHPLGYPILKAEVCTVCGLWTILRDATFTKCA